MWSALVLGGAVALGQPALPSAASPPEPRAGAEPESTPPPADPPAAVTIEVPPAPTPPEPPKPAPAPPDRWPLMQALQGTWYGAALDGNRLSISGWSDLTYTASSDRHDNFPMGWNFRANNFQIQQNWVRFERLVDPTATTPTWGFRWDTILPGTDYRYTVARGLFSNQLVADRGDPNLYGIDPIQFYGEGYFPQVGRGLDVKVGRFFALYGIESNDTTQNPFVSRAYSFINDPFTHTGVLTTLKLTDAWTVQNALTTGSDVFIDRTANPTYTGSAKWAPPDGRVGATLAVILGDGRFDREHNLHNPELFDLILSRKLSDRLTWQVETLYGFTTNVPNTGFANWLGVMNYLNYQLGKNLTLNSRLELFDDAQGQRTGFRGVYTAATAGVLYKPRPWLWLRPEVRFDHNDARPFEGKPDLFTAAANVVVRW
jgi:hypothetical protein